MEIASNTFGNKVKGLAQSEEKKAEGPFGQKISELAQTKDNTELSAAAKAKKQLNAAILESAVEVNVGAGNNPLSLVLKTALEGINDALKEATGEDNAIQSAYESGLDVSPEATADRIVSLSTAFFGQYKEQHPELDEQEALSKFTDIISGGIDKGFAEARDILEGLSVLEGDVATNIDKTYDLVQQGLKAFVEGFNEDE